jgi:hypothetical protein
MVKGLKLKRGGGEEVYKSRAFDSLQLEFRLP